MIEKQLTETQQMIQDCFQGCDAQWNALKDAMLNDSRFQRRIQEINYDKTGKCIITERYI